MAYGTIETRTNLMDRWELMTGNLVAMTSNNTPTPYTATSEGWITGGQAFNVFDDNINTRLNSDYTSAAPFGAILKLAFPIKIKKIYQSHGASGQSSYSWFCNAKLLDGNTVQIASDNNLSGDTTISNDYNNLEVNEILIYTYARSDLIAYIQEFKIIEWEQKV